MVITTSHPLAGRRRLGYVRHVYSDEWLDKNLDWFWMGLSPDGGGRAKKTLGRSFRWRCQRRSEPVLLAKED